MAINIFYNSAAKILPKYFAKLNELKSNSFFLKEVVIYRIPFTVLSFNNGRTITDCQLGRPDIESILSRFSQSIKNSPILVLMAL